MDSIPLNPRDNCVSIEPQTVPCGNNKSVRKKPPKEFGKVLNFFPHTISGETRGGGGGIGETIVA